MIYKTTAEENKPQRMNSEFRKKKCSRKETRNPFIYFIRWLLIFRLMIIMSSMVRVVSVENTEFQSFISM